MLPRTLDYNSVARILYIYIYIYIYTYIYIYIYGSVYIYCYVSCNVYVNSYHLSCCVTAQCTLYTLYSV